MMEAVTVAILSAITALCAVVLSPLVSIYVVKKEVGSSVLSANRQTWINNLRESISEFVSIMTFIYVGGWDTPMKVDKYERTYMLMAKIELMLNPNEEDHKQLASLLHAAYDHVATDKDELDPRLWHKCRKEIIQLSQTILKREWIRVKKIA